MSFTANTADVQEGDSSFDFYYNETSAPSGYRAVFGSTFIPVDPSRTYGGRIKAKGVAVGGGLYTGTFSAGFVAFDAAKQPLMVSVGPALNVVNATQKCTPFIADAVGQATLLPGTQGSLTAGAWQTFIGAVAGEGTTKTNFPVGTRFIKPCVATNYGGIGETRIDAFEIFESGPAAARAWINVKIVAGVVTVLDSYNVASFVRTANSVYTVTWASPFSSNAYVVTGGCNAWGNGGGYFTSEGNNIVGSATYGQLPGSASVGCRGGTAETDMLSVVAFGR